MCCLTLITLITILRVFDTMKCNLEPGKVLLREENMVNGFFLVVFLAPRIGFSY